MGYMSLNIMQFLWHYIRRSSYGTAYEAVPMLCPAARNKTRGNRRLNTFLVSALYESEC